MTKRKFRKGCMCKRDTPDSSNLGLVAHPKAVSLVALFCSWTDEQCPSAPGTAKQWGPPANGQLPLCSQPPPQSCIHFSATSNLQNNWKVRLNQKPCDFPAELKKGLQLALGGKRGCCQMYFLSLKKFLTTTGDTLFILIRSHG